MMTCGPRMKRAILSGAIGVSPCHRLLAFGVVPEEEPEGACPKFHQGIPENHLVWLMSSMEKWLCIVVIANLISGQSHLEGKFMMISSSSIAIEVCKTKDGLEMSVSFC